MTRLLILLALIVPAQPLGESCRLFHNYGGWQDISTTRYCRDEPACTVRCIARTQVRTCPCSAKETRTIEDCHA